MHIRKETGPMFGLFLDPERAKWWNKSGDKRRTKLVCAELGFPSPHKAKEWAMGDMCVHCHVRSQRVVEKKCKECGAKGIVQHAIWLYSCEMCGWAFCEKCLRLVSANWLRPVGEAEDSYGYLSCTIEIGRIQMCLPCFEKWKDAHAKYSPNGQDKLTAGIEPRKDYTLEDLIYQSRGCTIPNRPFVHDMNVSAAMQFHRQKFPKDKIMEHIENVWNKCTDKGKHEPHCIPERSGGFPQDHDGFVSKVWEMVKHLSDSKGDSSSCSDQS